MKPVFTGHLWRNRFEFKKEPFQERARKLLETMRITDPKKASLVKRARETLSKLIPRERGQIRGETDNLLKGRAAAQLRKSELVEFYWLQIRRAQVDIIKAKLDGFEPTSSKMKGLVQRVTDLNAQREALRKER